MNNENDIDLIDLFETHLANFIEEDDIIVFEDTESSQNPVDVYWIKPNAQYRPYSILVTCGLSQFAATVPEGFEENRYVEYAMLFPMNWDFENIQSNSNTQTWPIELLQSIKISNSDDTCFGFGYTIDWGNSKEECFPGTKFSSSIVLPSIKLPKEFTEIKMGNDLIKILSLIPIFTEELQFKQNKDTNSLIDRFNEFGIQEIINVNRKNTCK